MGEQQGSLNDRGGEWIKTRIKLSRPYRLKCIRLLAIMTYTEEQFQAVLDERKEIVERIGSENTAIHQRNYALKAAVKRLLDASWNGPIDAEHPARTYAANLLANTD